MNRKAVVLTRNLAFLPLPGLMLLTRFHHFGDALHLPDATLAVFFLAGLFRARWFGEQTLLVALMVLATAIDFAALAGGTSGWCVTPAYVFLFPGYALLWWAGRQCTAYLSMNWAGKGKITLWASLAIAGAFIISNLSFYLGSGYFGTMAAAEYTMRVSHYFPSYLGAGLLYVLLGLAVKKAQDSLAGLSVSGYKV